MRKIQPRNGNILIRRKKAESQTKGGLIIPEATQTKSRMGEVLAVGPGEFRKGSTERVPVSIKPGDVVFFRGTTSVRGEVTVDSEDLLILHENDIEAVIE